MLITKLSNLSIYWQDGARRRHIEEEPKRNRIVNLRKLQRCLRGRGPRLRRPGRKHRHGAEPGPGA